jgi:hypothetical protein
VLVCFSLAQIAPAQVARKAKKESGPRALGLVELSSDGKARLLPVCIMVDGKFYDAGAYKASPVPLALWTSTVYEGEKTGVPQGLFTIAEAGHVGNDVWFGVGKWVPVGSESRSHPKDKKGEKEKDAKPKFDEDEGPPKLRRSESPKPSDSGASTAGQSPSSQPDNKSPSTSAGSPPSSGEKPSPTAKAAAAPSGDTKPEDSIPNTSNDEDPNRPVLKRGKTETLGDEHPKVGASTGVPRRPAIPTAATETKKGSLQLIPAISDALRLPLPPPRASRSADPRRNPSRPSMTCSSARSICGTPMSQSLS